MSLSASIKLSLVVSRLRNQLFHSRHLIKPFLPPNFHLPFILPRTRPNHTFTPSNATMPTTPLPPAQPTDLPSLHAWLLSHPPYAGTNTPSPDPNDFTTLELHQFLASAITHFQQTKTSLAQALHAAKDEQICDTLVNLSPRPAW